MSDLLPPLPGRGGVTVEWVKLEGDDTGLRVTPSGVTVAYNGYGLRARTPGSRQLRDFARLADEAAARLDGGVHPDWHEGELDGSDPERLQAHLQYELDRWAHLLRERTAYENKEKKRVPDDHNRRLWSAASDILLIASRLDKEHGITIGLPCYFLDWMAERLSAFIEGRPEPGMTKAKGGKGHHRHKQMLGEMAVEYVALAEEGFLADPDPETTVRRICRQKQQNSGALLSHTAWEGWKKDYKKPPGHLRRLILKTGAITPVDRAAAAQDTVERWAVKVIVRH